MYSSEMEEPLKVLLFEGDRSDARRLRDALANDDAHWGRYELDVVARLSAGIRRLSKGDVSAILLDLTLPGNRGLDAVIALGLQAPEVPVIVLVPAAERAWGIKAVDAGAHDYLVTDKADGSLLALSLRYAIERKQLEKTLQQMTLVDDRCGVYNRRGFLRFADQQLKLIRRMGKRALIVVADIQGLREINETFGQAAGDVAINDGAAVLKQTFRESDVIGRIGGDEFAIVAIGAADDGPRSILRRLAKALAAYNDTPDRRFHLAMSLGVASSDPGDGSALEHLLAEATRDFYGKRGRRTRAQAGVAL